MHIFIAKIRERRLISMLETNSLKTTCAVILAALCIALQLRASDWPCYRGEHGDGIVTGEFASAWPPEGPRKLWSVPLRDDGAGTHAGASIVAGRVYVPGKSKDGDVESDVVYCFDANTGSEIWHYAYAAPERHDDVYGTGIRIQPSVDEQRVYTIGCYGQLVCLDRASGKLLWRRDLLEEFNGKPPSFGMSAAPLLAGDLLICETGGGKAVLAALDKKSGKTVWESGDDGASYATPQTALIGGVEQVIVFLASGLNGYDLKSGRELWRYPYPDERRKNVPAPIIDKNRIYLANNSLGFNAIDIAQENGSWSARKIWSSRGAKMHFSCPVIGAPEDACLYFHDGKREVKCLALANGAIQWGAPNMGREEAVLLRLGAHHLLAAPDNGEIVLLRVSAKNFEETGRFRAFDAKEKLYVQPSVADGRMYVRDHAALACYDLSPSGSPVAAANAPAIARTESVDDARKRAKIAALNPHVKSSDDLSQAWHAKKSAFTILGLAGLSLALLAAWLNSQKHYGAGLLASESAALGLALVVWVRALRPEGVKAALGKHNWLHSAGAEKQAALCLATIAALLWLLPRISGGWKLAAACLALALPLLLLQLFAQGSADISYILYSLDVRDTRSSFNDLLTCAAGVFAFIFATRLSVLQTHPRITLLLAAIVTGFTAGSAVQITGVLFALACLIFPALTIGALGLFKRSVWLAGIAATLLVLAALAAALSLSDTLRLPPAPLTSGILGVAWLCCSAVGLLTGRSALKLRQ